MQVVLYLNSEIKQLPSQQVYKIQDLHSSLTDLVESGERCKKKWSITDNRGMKFHILYFFKYVISDQFYWLLLIFIWYLGDKG